MGKRCWTDLPIYELTSHHPIISPVHSLSFKYRATHKLWRERPAKIPEVLITRTLLRAGHENRPIIEHRTG